ncbi:MAG: hypothetical protein P8N43_00100 [Alphaproteobacteria bacterium]|nr:hypothetical protein [Alphaproteobacteria bacterium]
MENSVEKNSVNEFVTELLKAKDVEIGILKEQLKALRQSTQDFKLYKSLVEDGAIYVNTYSQDCDGVEAYSSSVYKTIEEYREGEEIFAESVEGRCSWKIVAKKDARPQEECGTFGQGWGIN